MMKICFKCKLPQAFTDFYLLRTMHDGRMGKCKHCARKDRSSYYRNNVDRLRAEQRIRSADPEAREWIRQWKKTPEGRACVQALNRKWKQENPRKISAQVAFNSHRRKYNIPMGSCVICGNHPADAHHENYERPLEVVWLCKVHHYARHREMRLEGIVP